MSGTIDSTKGVAKEELFPKSEFPLRARLTVEYPARSLREVHESYYQKPPLGVYQKQTTGLFFCISSFDGSLSWKRAVRRKDGEETVFTVTEDGALFKVCDKECEDVDSLVDSLLEFLGRFSERFGDVLDDEEVARIMNDKIDSARWEMF